MLAVIVVGTAGSVGATRFLKPEYKATATIYIEPPPDDAGPIRAAELLRSFGWLELLTTGVVLDSVAITQRLYLTPAKREGLAGLRGLRPRREVRDRQLQLEGGRVRARPGRWTRSGRASVDSGRGGGLHRAEGRASSGRRQPASLLGRAGASRSASSRRARPARSSLASFSTQLNNPQQANFIRLSLVGPNAAQDRGDPERRDDAVRGGGRGPEAPQAGHPHRDARRAGQVRRGAAARGRDQAGELPGRARSRCPPRTCRWRPGCSPPSRRCSRTTSTRRSRWRS